MRVAAMDDDAHSLVNALYAHLHPQVCRKITERVANPKLRA